MTEHYCRQCVELLMDYVEGRLSPQDKVTLDEHFAKCPPCLDFMRSYRETPRIMREATATKMPVEVKQKLRLFLEQKKRMQ
ncbi:MAG TPA: zf-HC2 domain-containing protein [Polyangia bacterium]|nr:zf-HC2 domain-containing protein [Polyangia bacterium]